VASLVLFNGANVVRYRGHRIWAERGYIHIERDDTGEYQMIHVKNAVERVKAIGDMTTNTRRMGKREVTRGLPEIEDYDRFVKQMTHVIARAIEQGVPFEPGVTEHRLALAPKQFSMARVSPIFGTGELFRSVKP
jgi:hypothetical protein